jgi:hypothetical protein
MEQAMAQEQFVTQETIDEQIRRDHRRSDREIVELELRTRGAGDEELGAVFAPMKRELFGHMAAEETVLYSLFELDLPQDIAKARGEHDRIRRHLEELAAGGGMEESEWRRRLVVVKQEIQQHYAWEEGQLLPCPQEEPRRAAAP